MGLYQTLYFMSLVGGIAGLLSWAVVAVISAFIQYQPFAGLSDLLSAAVLGAFIGGFTVAFSDRWSGNRVITRWVLSGALIGLAAGIAAGLLEAPVIRALAPAAPTLSRILAWMIAGSFIGLGLGLRWVRVNRA